MRRFENTHFCCLLFFFFFSLFLHAMIITAVANSGKTSVRLIVPGEIQVRGIKLHVVIFKPISKIDIYWCFAIIIVWALVSESKVWSLFNLSHYIALSSTMWHLIISKQCPSKLQRLSASNGQHFSLTRTHYNNKQILDSIVKIHM